MHNRKDIRSSKSFLSSNIFLILLGIFFSVISVFLWKTQESRNLAQIYSSTEAKARSYSSETEIKFGHVYKALVRLASKGIPEETIDIDAWTKDAAFYIETFEGVERIAWINGKFLVQKIVPLKDNQQYLNQSVSDDGNKSDVEMWVPIYDGEYFKGYILGTLSIRTFLTTILNEIKDDYMIQIIDEGISVFKSENWNSPNEKFIISRTITLENNSILNMSIVPTKEIIDSGIEHAGNTFFYSLLFSLISISTVFFAQKYRAMAIKNKSHYRGLFNASQDAIFLINLKGEYEDANQAALRMVGYTLTEIQKLSVNDLQEQTNIVPLDKNRQLWKEGGQLELSLRHKNGQMIPVDLMISPIDEYGFKKNILGIARDITEKKEAQIETLRLLKASEKSGQVLLSVIEDVKLGREEIKKLNEDLEQRVTERTLQLEAANKELEAFSYSVSHDLRAPLRHISGYIDLLTEHFTSSIPEKGLHYLSSIKESTSHMGLLIDALLKFSRTGKQEMQKTNIEMNALLQDVLKRIKRDTDNRKIKWITPTLPNVFADYDLLSLVWENLLSNAVKFTGKKEKAIIEIGYKEENNDIVFFVRDNGTGFDMQYAKKLFGVFQRLHSSEEFEGTGIGLANVQRIILRHGGHCRAEAEIDKGATFYFTLK